MDSHPSPYSDARPDLLRSPLVLMAPRTDGIEAVWAVSRASRAHVEFETADGDRRTIGCDAFGLVPQGDEVIRVRIDDLTPGATYRVRSVTTAIDDEETVTSDWKTFRTLDYMASSTHFVVWNDTHQNNDGIQQLHAATPPADFLVWNGDTCNDWNDATELVPTLLNPGGCDISAGRPLFQVWGNHDVRGPHAFRMPSIVATPEGRPFYAFRSGPVGVICLHTGEDKPDSHHSFKGRVAFDELREEQAAWLAVVIQRPEMRDAPYRVVFCHIPLRWTDEGPQDYAKNGYDRHSGRGRYAWHDSLVAWRAQIIISGHNHEPTWMPPTEQWPYGQLIGGDREPERATWIGGTANATELLMRTHTLAGKVLHNLTFPPLL